VNEIEREKSERMQLTLEKKGLRLISSGNQEKGERFLEGCGKKRIERGMLAPKFRGARKKFTTYRKMRSTYYR